uniref:Uncharacterized protein n=1 Tax=viral metagenome TaxID=1070528 RepID=A0A6M3L1N0_9ZZZZ
MEYNDPRTLQIRQLQKKQVKAMGSGEDIARFSEEIAKLRKEIAEEAEAEYLKTHKITHLKSEGVGRDNVDTKGFIRVGGKHSWRIQFYTGEWRFGKRCRYYETVRGSYYDAQQRLAELNADKVHKSIPVNPSVNRLKRELEELREEKRKSEAEATNREFRLRKELDAAIFERDNNIPPERINPESIMRLKPRQELRKLTGLVSIQK